jgi:hypothetical protein
MKHRSGKNLERDKAVKIAVANIKLDWVEESWNVVQVCVTFPNKGEVLFFSGLERDIPHKTDKKDGWVIPRKWLEEKGHI